jgi:hypothetical protein
MQAILINLLASLLLAQSALAAASHCAHACLRCDEVAAAQTESNCCQHHSQNERTPATPRPCECRCQAVPAYLPSPKSHVEASQSMSALDLAALPASTVQAPCGTLLITALIGGPPRAESPCRLHLLHRQLLI